MVAFHCWPTVVLGAARHPLCQIFCVSVVTIYSSAGGLSEFLSGAMTGCVYTEAFGNSSDVKSKCFLQELFWLELFNCFELIFPLWTKLYKHVPVKVLRGASGLVKKNNLNSFSMWDLRVIQHMHFKIQCLYLNAYLFW